MGKRLRECTAKALIFSGITIALGSVGACENGDYTILQCAACMALGAVLGLAGWGIKDNTAEGRDKE